MKYEVVILGFIAILIVSVSIYGYNFQNNQFSAGTAVSSYQIFNYNTSEVTTLNPPISVFTNNEEDTVDILNTTDEDEPFFLTSFD